MSPVQIVLGCLLTSGSFVQARGEYGREKSFSLSL